MKISRGPSTKSSWLYDKVEEVDIPRHLKPWTYEVRICADISINGTKRCSNICIELNEEDVVALYETLLEGKREQKQFTEIGCRELS